MVVQRANRGLVRGSPVYTLAIDPQSPSTLYVGTLNGVFRSEDAGVSWTSVSTELESSFVSILVMDRRSDPHPAPALASRGTAPERARPGRCSSPPREPGEPRPAFELSFHEGQGGGWLARRSCSAPSSSMRVPFQSSTPLM